MEPLLSAALVDRDEHLAAIREALKRAGARAGGLVFVVAEAGMGKSRLVLEARDMAGAGRFRVVSGRAVPRPAPPPYRPLAEALQQTILDSEAIEDEELKPFTRILHRLLARPGPEAETAAAELGELAVAEAVTRILAANGRSGGCAVFLEDLHWADAETLAVVEYLADHLAHQPVLVVATIRAGENSEAERLAHHLRERRAATVLHLGRLTEDGVDRMLVSCLGSDSIPPEVREFVHSHAEGVPFFVEELLAGLVASGALSRSGRTWDAAAPLTPVVPRTYAEAIGRRLHALGPVDQEVVVAAAILGRRFDWALLPAITGLAPAAVLDGLRLATASSLLEPEPPDAFRFRHALSRDAVLADLLPPEQAAVATRALDALEALGDQRGDDDAGLAAELAERAGDRPRAVDALLTIARSALRRGALTSAQSVLERAAALARPLPELAILVEEVAAHAAALAGDVDDAIRRAARVLAELPGGDVSAERSARLHLTLARAALVAGRWSDATRHVSDARTLTSTGSTALRASADVLASQVALASGRDQDAAELARSVVARDGRSGFPAAVCEAMEVLGRLARPVDVQEARRHFDEALALAEEHDLALWRARALHELGTLDLFEGRTSQRFQDARAAAVDAGAVAAVALCDLHLAVAAYSRWDPAPGLESGRRCVDLSRRLGLNTLGMGLVHLATCHAMALQVDEMEEALAEAAPFAGTERDVAAGIPGRARTTLALRLGDFAGARVALDEAMDMLRLHPGAHFPFRGLWALLCTVEDGAGATAATRARAEAAAGAGAAIFFNPLCLELAEAVVLGQCGRGDEAAGIVEALLVDGLTGPSRRGWGSVAVGATASAALRDGWGEGDAWARLALAHFEEAGFDEMASWCRALLRHAGLPVPRRRGSTVAPVALKALGVTSREADVLSAVSSGATNKEIAARLYLSPRTVERHVSNLLAKMGAADRRDLAARANRVMDSG